MSSRTPTAMQTPSPSPSTAPTPPLPAPHPAVVIPRIYELLLDHFGFLDWWPGETRDEIIIGAVLTQNTAWTNVEKAIRNLRDVRMLTLSGVASCPRDNLEELIKPTGYFRQKAERLQLVASTIVQFPGGPDGFFDILRSKDAIRADLLGMKGIGPETADSILLYTGSIPSFVIDAYTYRALIRLGLYEGKYDYHRMQELITSHMDEDVERYGDYHAQMVELGKNYCRKRRPVCSECPLCELCPGVGL